MKLTTIWETMTMQNNNLHRALMQAGADVVRIMKANIGNDMGNPNGKFDTGMMYDSTHWEISRDGDDLTLQIFSTDYAKYVEYGRSPFQGFPAMRHLSGKELADRRKQRLGTRPFEFDNQETENQRYDVELGNAFMRDVAESLSVSFKQIFPD